MISCMGLNRAWEKRNHVLPINVSNQGLSPQEALNKYFWVTEQMNTWKKVFKQTDSPCWFNIINHFAGTEIHGGA